MNTKRTDSRSIRNTTGMILAAMMVSIAASAGASELFNGLPVTVSGTGNPSLAERFFVAIPAGARFLRYGVEAGLGDFYFYKRLGAEPTFQAYDERTRVESGGSYYQRVEDPDPGTWYFMIGGIDDFTDVKLQVDFWGCEGGCEDRGELDNGAQEIWLSAAQHGAVFFRMEIPDSASNIEFSLSGGNGDADLYVSRGIPPVLSFSSPFPTHPPEHSSCVSENGDNDEHCFFATSEGPSNTWYVFVYAYEAFYRVTLTAGYEEARQALDLAAEADLVAPGVSESGETYFDVRNHLATGQNVTVSYYGDTVTAEGPLRQDTVFLGPHQARMLALSGAPQGTALVLVADSRDTQRSISGAVLRVDPGNDFATGERAVTRDDFCSQQVLRFLDFGSGSLITLLLKRPQSDATAYTFRAYDEAGTEIASGDRSASSHLLRFPVADLVGSGNRFGTLLFDFPEGGWVSARYEAFGRYSAEVAGDCAD